jgi:protein-disulfide isomerase
MRTAVLLTSALLLAGAAAAQKRTGPYRPIRHQDDRPAFDKAKLEAYLRRVELWPPQVTVRIDDPKPFVDGLYTVDVHLSSGPASRDDTYYITGDGRKVIRGRAFDLREKPFQHELDILQTSGAPSFGPADAPMTLVVFSDFECPICREEAKALRTNIPKEFPQEVRVVFKDFPLPAIHPWAEAAAIAGRCVFHQNAGAFWAYHDWAYEKQPELTAGNLRAKLLEWAKSQPLDILALTHCVDSRATAAEVAAEVAEGKRLDVEATPTLFLNGRRLVGQVPWENLSQIIRLELQYMSKP